MRKLDEALTVLAWIAKVNRTVTIPFIEKKTGLKVVSVGANLGEMVTEVDLGVSAALLDGSMDLNVPGVRSMCPGSFSEEQDTEERLASLDIIEVDPIDGTPPFKETYHTPNVISPTTLVTRLTRRTTADPFRPIWGIIYHITSGLAIVGDEEGNVGLYRTDSNGSVREVPCRRINPKPWTLGDPLFVPRRISFTQPNFDVAFLGYLKKRGYDVRTVSVGGSGEAQLHLFRNFLEPEESGAEAFAAMEPLTVLFGAHPDSKTWDLDPGEVVTRTFGMPGMTDMFGEKIVTNAAARTPGEMVRRTGYMLAANHELQDVLCKEVIEFTRRNPDVDVIAADYWYGDAVKAMMRGEAIVLAPIK